MIEIIMGIDPGMTGGIAILGKAVPIVYKMPPTEKDIWDVISYKYWAAWEQGSIFAYIENVSGSVPGSRGVQGIAKLKYNYGLLSMALVASEIPFERVAPGKWQREFGLYGKKWKSDTEKKNKHKERAQELFPSVKVTHAIADALLISEYGRRLRSKN